MNNKQLTLTLSAGLSLSLATVALADNPALIQAQPLNQGYQNVTKVSVQTGTATEDQSSSKANEGKCSEGKCSEGKCAEGQCGNSSNAK